MEFDTRPPSGSEAADPGGMEAHLGLGRQLRHVLIPSELVSVEINPLEGGPQTLQADLINVSGGGCCLVLPRCLDLPIGSQGVLLRSVGSDGALERRGFEVRWVQDLGEMIEIGVQYVEV